MKKTNEYEYDLGSDLTIIGLIYFIIVFGALHLKLMYNEYKVNEELMFAKKLVVDMYNENSNTYNVINELNNKLHQKNVELKEFNDLKQLKEDVREFWNRR